VNDKPRGVPCPKCECCHHSTLETRKAEVPINGKIVSTTRRKRLCRHCDHRFWTTELNTEQVAKLK
jgi:transcriptional regulator NrdR family protein